nr:MAG TPA: hypothetical protein [Caudoviricetes sp.]
MVVSLGSFLVHDGMNCYLIPSYYLTCSIQLSRNRLIIL